jgi:hypothetical protein
MALDVRCALPKSANIDQVVGRLLDRGLVVRPSRGRGDGALPLVRAFLRRRADLTPVSLGR